MNRAAPLRAAAIPTAFAFAVVAMFAGAAVIAPAGACAAEHRPVPKAPPPAAPAVTDEWEYSVTGNGYLFPGDGDFLLGIGTADRGALHLEARFNYEDRDTGSLWGGWNFSGGKTVEWTVTPMFGVAAGDTDAVASGVEFSLAWKQIDYYFEGEALYDLHDSGDNFVYGWSELGWTPCDWLRVGLVGQRTRIYDTGLDIQRGVLAQAIAGRWAFGADWFNPGSDDAFTVLVLEVTF